MQVKSKIILVDDSDQKRATYSDKFKSEGFEVFEAVDGKKGLELIKEKKPDLIFTGIDMPEMDGFTMIRELKKNPNHDQLALEPRERSANRKRARRPGIHLLRFRHSERSRQKS